jgi:hypothetical protein
MLKVDRPIVFVRTVFVSDVVSQAMNTASALIQPSLAGLNELPVRSLLPVVSDSIVMRHEVTEMNDDLENPEALDGTWQPHMDIQQSTQHPHKLKI